MSENFPCLSKETNIQVKEAQRIPQKDEPKEVHTKIHYNLNGKIKDKQRILKAAKEKVTYYVQEILNKSIGRFSSRNHGGRR